MAEGFVKIDDRELRALLRDAPRQIPFAISYALNRLAFLARDDIRVNMEEDGINLRREWVRRGIRVLHKATKRDLQSDVGSIDPIMAAAAYGGDRPYPGLIPMVGPGLPRSSPDAVIGAKWRRDANLLERVLNQKSDQEFGKRRFIIGQGVYERYKPIDRTRKSKSRASVVFASQPIRRIFTIPVGPVRIRSRWKFQERIDKSLAANWTDEMENAVYRALETARPKQTSLF